MPEIIQRLDEFLTPAWQRVAERPDLRTFPIHHFRQPASSRSYNGLAARLAHQLKCNGPSCVFRHYHHR